MSSITWDREQLVQRVGNDSEELGYVSLDSNSATYVLWLKDTVGVLDLNGGYIRGDEYASMADAKSNAAASPSAFIMHYIWMRRLTKRRVIEALDEHWDIISSELEGHAEKQILSDRISEYVDQLSGDEIKKWGKKISDGLIVSALIDLVKSLFMG